MIPTLQLGQLGRSRVTPLAGSFLDQLATTPRMALSMKKKLISTATSALRVRRSSDSAEQDIAFSGSTLDSSSMASFVGANSGFLRSLYDQTGNSEDANQPTAANQPRLVNAGTPDAMATWDGSDDGLVISSLTAGAAQLGIYLKFKMPSGSGVKIIFEQSINYNDNAQSMVVYYDSSNTKKLAIAVRNSTGASDYTLLTFDVVGGATAQVSILVDRTQPVTDDIKVWVNGAASSPTTISATNQTGVFSTYDAYLGSRAGSSLFADMALESLVIYNADTSAIRTSIEAMVA